LPDFDGCPKESAVGLKSAMSVYWKRWCGEGLGTRTRLCNCQWF